MSKQLLRVWHTLWDSHDYLATPGLQAQPRRLVMMCRCGHVKPLVDVVSPQARHHELTRLIHGHYADSFDRCVRCGAEMPDGYAAHLAEVLIEAGYRR